MSRGSCLSEAKTEGAKTLVDRAVMPLGAPFWPESDQSAQDKEREIRFRSTGSLNRLR